MGGEKTGKLSGSCLRAVDDEGHEEQGEGQEFGVKGYNEEGYGACRVVLGECIRVGEGEGWEEGV